jgi:thiamine-monophosphate kinase
MAGFARLDEQGFIDLVASLVGPARRSGTPRLTPSRTLPRAPRPIVGIGDDAAVLAAPPGVRALLTTDLLTDGIHFHLSYTPGFLLGRKALAVSLSDIAAMGGVPHSFVVGVGLPRTTPPAYARDLARGLADQARRFGVALVGGDTSASRSLFVSIALLGVIEPGREVRRSGACPGDGLYVTGSLGAAAAGLALLRRAGRKGTGARRPRGARRLSLARQAIRAHRDPVPRTDAGRALGLTGLGAAMIDLSDGLAQDLPRLCRASRCGAIIEEAAIPVASAARAVLGQSGGLRSALSGGEDYELLFAARRDHDSAVRRLARRLRLPMTRIGQILPRDRGVRILRRDGSYQPFDEIDRGFEHFPAARRDPRH